MDLSFITDDGVMQYAAKAAMDNGNAFFICGIISIVAIIVLLVSLGIYFYREKKYRYEFAEEQPGVLYTIIISFLVLIFTGIISLVAYNSYCEGANAPIATAQTKMFNNLF